MSIASKLGGTFTLPGTDLSLNRIGYGAMQLTGPHIWGPPKDREAALAVLRQAVESGVNHIDTSDFYGPHVTNQLIREALHPYPGGLTIVTKVGGKRGPDASWLPANSAAELTQAVHDNLRNLGLDVLEAVNFRAWGTRLAPGTEPIAEPFTALVELQRQGLIRSPLATQWQLRRQQVEAPPYLRDQAGTCHSAKQFPLLFRCNAQRRGQLCCPHRLKLSHLSVCEK